MKLKLISIGYGTIICANRIISIISPESAPVKRIIQEAKAAKKIIDATYGKRTRSVIIMDSDHVILSAVQPETVANRVNAKTLNLKEKKEVNSEESKDNDYEE